MRKGRCQWKSRLGGEAEVAGKREGSGTHRDSATRWVTRGAPGAAVAWTRPVTPRKSWVLARTAKRSKTLAHTTRFTKPVSSWSVMKVAPLAVAWLTPSPRAAAGAPAVR